ncbi:hypothetical protein FOA43_004252 [Brettanomyces nanus]|uniref:Uncharacterized protein n=1 Tax=Eeniella nana TaxID=13502 RepID=A0A875S7C8_EENNA|nr:uncharacterized protein FOA43_004252 [Brettanomyces nanus]QPG76858.1 hypothetical protein FOA43_004252 [Brettanomyces nanus]
MGKCLTIVKLVGIGSLGIAGANFLYSAKALIPHLLVLDNLRSETTKKQITDLIVKTRSVFWSLGALATFLFYEAFKCSPPAGKHPYLIYTSLIAPLGLVYNYYWVFDSEARLLESSSSEPKITYKKVKKLVKVKKPAQAEKSPLDNSVYSDLGNVPVVEEEVEVEEEVPVHQEPTALSNTQTKHELSNLKIGYTYSSFITGFGFILSIIGFIGDRV